MGVACSYPSAPAQGKYEKFEPYKVANRSPGSLVK